MPQPPVEGAAQAAPKSLVSRLIGVIVAPKATFQSVVANPSWFGMLALLCVAMAILVGGFLLTKVGQQAWLDSATTSSFSGRVTDQQYEAMAKIAPYVGYIAVVQMLIGIPIICLITAGILFAVFNAAMGGTATFKQLYAVVVHSSAISLLGQCYTVPMNYLRGTMSSASTLGVLLPMVDDTSLVGRLLGMIDLFLIWWLVVLAIGLGVLYRRKTSPIAWSLLSVYAVIAVIIAVIRSRMGGA
jgi:Yip1 domain